MIPTHLSFLASYSWSRSRSYGSRLCGYTLRNNQVSCNSFSRRCRRLTLHLLDLFGIIKIVIVCSDVCQNQADRGFETAPTSVQRSLARLGADHPGRRDRGDLSRSLARRTSLPATASAVLPLVLESHIALRMLSPVVSGHETRSQFGSEIFSLFDPKAVGTRVR
jgi:hypothetical protein